nr:histidine kinase [Mucilaginibacter straminoryzae]
MVQEEERKRIAGDLHDEIGAVISIMKMNLMLMKQSAEDNQTSTASVKVIQNLINLSDNAITSVRSISHQLMPPQLEAFGLVKTIESVIDQINANGKITFYFTIRNEWPPVNWPVALGVYRIVMELFNNTIKHANARCVFLTFDYFDNYLIVSFEDDGDGFPSQTKNYHGLGLISMEARAQAMNALFECTNGTSRGVKATLKIPVG